MAKPEGTIHYRKYGAKQAVCGMSHEKMKSASRDSGKVTCPQCRRVMLDEHAQSEAKSKRKK